jgi:hypothetical protein
MADMLTRRDRVLIGSGFFIGMGVGTFAGACLFVVSAFLLLHHMFIMGVNWDGMIVLTAVPLAFVICGAAVFRRGRRTV